MKLSYKEIIEAQGALKNLQNKPIPIKQGLVMARLIRKLTELMNDFAVVRDGLKTRYGIEYERSGEITKFISATEGNAQRFTNELNELLNQEIEVVITAITLPDSLEVEPSVLVPLEKFIETLAP